MKTSNVVWAIIVIIIIFSGLYFLLMMIMPAQPSTISPNNLELNDSQNQTNTGQNNVVTPVLKVSTDATLGEYLVASNGMTLYLFTVDALNLSNCYGDCAVKWPPYSPKTIEPVDIGVTGKLSMISRTDGTQQLAYNGVPLYYWYLDVKPGDTTGHNVGGVWFVVKP